MNTSNWALYDFELKRRLGEITIGTNRLLVMRRLYSIAEIRDGNCSIELPPLQSGCEGFLLSGIPQENTPGSIEHVGEYIRYCIKTYLRCYIDMTYNFDAYKNKFSAKTRSGISRKIRKFSEHAGSLDFRCYQTPDELHSFFDLARGVSAKSYQERLLDCGLPTSQDFVRAAITAAANNQIRAFLLFVKGVPVSYLYCPAKDGVLEYAYLGYAPEYSKLSPGTVLQWLALEHLFSERSFSAFDFTEGDSEHKRLFSTHQTQCSLELVLRPTLRNRFIIQLHRHIAIISDFIGNHLERIGLKNRIKGWLRRVA